MSGAPARGSSVIDLSGLKPGGPQTSQGAWRSLRRVLFSAKDLADPERLYEVVYKVQDLIFQGIGPVLQNAIVPGNRLTSVAFSSGQTRILAHGLGRAYQGYFHVRAIGGYGAFQEVALPSGVSNSTSIALQALNGGTFDLYIF